MAYLLKPDRIDYENYPSLEFMIYDLHKENNELLYLNPSCCFSLRPEIKDWIKENIRGGWYFKVKEIARPQIYHLEIFFTQEQSLVLFKLRYG